MKKPPCEWRVRELIPVIRASIAKILVEGYGYSIYQASKVMGVTPAAVSNYLTMKRSRANIVQEILEDEKSSKLINEFVKRVVAGELEVGEALCALCRRLADCEAVRKIIPPDE